ncbi:MAG TPA: FliM/FliN family flagellar motor C-terminal domain-containing protein [Edaphobacter sp.]|jgi:flagellar motor switch/type III secretory pathway protein FliN|nr:FliM/FliN family flagellar motor C-terminal domain-containing protein [Edaphobacter sp.]
MIGTELAMRSADGGNETGLELVRGMPPVPWVMRMEEHSSWETLSQLRMTLRVRVTLKRFNVRDLLSIEVGQVFESLSPAAEDVPVMIGQVQIGWSEFEVLEQRMALRLTRLG